MTYVRFLQMFVCEGVPLHLGKILQIGAQCTPQRQSRNSIVPSPGGVAILIVWSSVLVIPLGNTAI